MKKNSNTAITQSPLAPITQANKYPMIVSSRSFSPIKKSKRAFEEVAATIKDSILNGYWKPGDRLPSETELGNQFGVSRHTIREALRALELSGLITIRTGVAGGPIVQDTIMSTISSLYLDAFQMEKISVDEFTAARLAIEEVILSDAIEKANEEDIAKLKENVLKAKKLASKGEIVTDVNFEFHSLLAQASKNRVFIVLEKTINTIHHNLRSRAPVDFKISRDAAQAHENLLEAIVKKQYEKARKLMGKHIAAVKKSYSPEQNNSKTQLEIHR